MGNRGTKKLREERGQALVEFALVAPLLLMLVFGIVQLGLAYNTYVQLTDAVRAGARQAAVTHSEDAAVTTVRESGNLDPAKLAVEVAPASDDWQSGDDVTVEATYPYSIDILGIVVKSGDLKSRTTERIE
jgi:hypothetical protein